MSQITEVENRMTGALQALRKALSNRDSAAKAQPDGGALNARIAELEAEKTAMRDEMERLRTKRDKDVAALDELIAQLKPLIEEV